MSKRPARVKRLAPAIRRALQRRQESVRVLAKRYGISPSTVQKWRTRRTIADAERESSKARSSVLSSAQEAAIVALRVHALPSLDECHAMLQPWMPHLTRSSLHRCLTRHGLSRLPQVREKPVAGTLWVHAVQLQCADAHLSVLFAVEQVNRQMVARFADEMTVASAGSFLDAMVQGAKRPIRHVRTRQDIWFTAGVNRDKDKHGVLREHPFERACWLNDSQHSVVQEGNWWSAEQFSAANVLIGEAARAQRQKDAKAVITRFLNRYNKDFETKDAI